jgi:glycosyltransferase involved in cell wall biosynthesis
VRVLIINYEFPPIGAGGGKASYSIAKELVAMGHRVRVLTAQPLEPYSLAGSALMLMGLVIASWLGYREITVDIDIGGEGFTTIAVLFFLSGLILRAMGFMWGLLIPFKGLPRKELLDGIEVRRVPALRQRRESCSLTEMLSFLISGALFGLRHAATFRPDIVHVFFGIPCGPIGWVIKRFQRVPYIISLRGADVPSSEVERFRRIYPLLKPALRRLWRDADAVVAVSNGLRNAALETSDIDMTVIPNAIDLSQFIPGEIWEVRGEAERVEGGLRLLFVGRLTKAKNARTLLDAVAIAASRTNTPIMLRIVGDGAERVALEEQAVSLGLAARVQFSGWVDRAEIAAVYRNADVFVTASYWEGMPNTMLEAMACALPIVASDVQGHDELVRPGINGYLVPPGDPDRLAQAILLLADDRPERRRMGRESRRIAGEVFDWESIAMAYVRVYESAIAGTTRTTARHGEGP